MESKICKKCGVEKPLTEFTKVTKNKDGHDCNCKTCTSEKRKEYQQINVEVIKERNRKNYLNNKEVRCAKSKEYREQNYDKVKEYKKVYQEKNRDKLNKYLSDYHANNKETHKIKGKEYREKNKGKIKEQSLVYVKNNQEMINEKKRIYYQNNKEKRNDYLRNRLAIDYLFRLKTNVRGLIHTSFKYRGYAKKSKTVEILGCSFEEFMLYIESKFEPWMNWENKGLYNGTPNYGWDIDHIIPMSSAQNETEVIKLNHYTNLQPLCSYVNRVVKRHNINYGE